MALVALAGCDLVYAFDYAPPVHDVSPETNDLAARYDQPAEVAPVELGGADDLARDAQSEEQLSPCDKLFSAAVPGYLFCAETATSCTFYYSSTTGGRSCQDLCGANTCLKMEDNQAINDCTPEVPNSCTGVPCVCSTKMVDSICTCQK